MSDKSPVFAAGKDGSGTESMKVAGLHIYPVKSCAGISVQHATVLERGFEFDRRFMLVDAEHRFMTQRKHPRLALIKTAIENDILRLSVHGQSDLRIALQPAGGESIKVTVWDDTLNAIAISQEANSWFSDFLKTPCKLVHMPETTVRLVGGEYRTNNEHYSLADAFPFLLTSKESLDELNRRLAAPVPMNRFRPNIVVSGFHPFAEDEWRVVQIGEVRMRVAKPCTRCSTTTVDQSTGVRGIEPLHTLNTFRKRGGDVLFGQNLIHKTRGVISVGDAVDVVE